MNVVAHKGDLAPGAHIFHCLAEARVVHQLIKVFFEIVCGLGALGRVELNPGLHPGLLVEFKDAVDPSQLHAVLHIELEVTDVANVVSTRPQV